MSVLITAGVDTHGHRRDAAHVALTIRVASQELVQPEHPCVSLIILSCGRLSADQANISRPLVSQH